MPKPLFKRTREPKKGSMKRIPPVPCPPDLVMQLQQNATHGSCVEFTKPEQAAHAVWLRAQGMAYAKIEAITGLKFDSIRALCWRQEDTLESKKKEFSRRYAQIAEQFGDVLTRKAERMLEDETQIDNVSPDKLALTIGIMTDQAAKLSGMAGVIIEHRKGASIDDAANMIAEARARIAAKINAEAIPAEIIE